MNDQLFSDLHRKSSLTGAARFAASTRQAAHAKASQWSVAILSVVLIIVSVGQALGLLRSVPNEQLTLLQVGISTLVLVFSLLLGLENYAVRSERSHRCGLELNEVARRAEALVGSGATVEKYTELCEAYERILAQHENHEQLDYLMQKSRWRKNYPAGWFPWIADAVTSRARYIATFWPYLALMWLAWSALRPVVQLLLARPA